METTVVYYTSNSEDETFEARIRERLLGVIGDLPLVSVSQKPLPGFGKNICVGEHDNCYGNLWRQVFIALKEVETKWVLTAEADTLYPPEYFTFSPPRKAPYYRYAPVYNHYYLGKDGGFEEPKFFLKGTSNGVQIIDRDYWFALMDWTLDGEKEWFNKGDLMPLSPRVQTNKRQMWRSENAAIAFKTGKGVGKFAKSINKDSKYELPYWGSAENLRREMFE